MFRTELRKFGRLYQLSATISRPQAAPDGETASWTIETKAGDWQTHTRYDFLRWEDLIKRDLASPIWRTVFHAMWIYWCMVFGGTVARFWKAHWRFATFISYPHYLLFNEALLSLGIAFGFARGLEALGIPGPFSIAAATAVFVAALGTMLKYTENQTYLLYCCPTRSGPGNSRTVAARTGTSVLTDLRNTSPTSHAAVTPRKSLSSATVRDRSWGPRLWRARSSSILISDGTVRALSCSRSAAISRSSVFMPPQRISAITSASWRSSLRSTGSTASRARM